MKQSYKIMAGILLSGTVLAALMAVIAKSSLLPELGRHMDVSAIGYSAYQDSQQMKAACERTAPEIISKGIKIWKPGDEILIDEVFEGKDTEGNQTEIKILDIRNQNGDCRMEYYQKEEHKIVFPEKGMYLLELQTVDRQKKSKRKSFILLVDSR